ncbi:MAG: dephospho-CoA kinase, partial [Candidatus Izemoplasmataceae bacterium]
MAKIIGLTGGIATGKSTVTQMFKERNIPVIDSDKIAKNLLDKGQEAYQEILAE